MPAPNGALSDVGGQKWLVKQATLNPTAFMGLRIKRPQDARTRARQLGRYPGTRPQRVRFALRAGDDGRQALK
jgi:hypothetical protein